MTALFSACLPYPRAANRYYVKVWLTQKVADALLGSLPYNETQDLARRDNFIEQRQHRSMTPHVVDVDECGASVQRPHGFDSKIMRLPAVIGDLVSRHY